MEGPLQSTALATAPEDRFPEQSPSPACPEQAQGCRPPSCGPPPPPARDTGHMTPPKSHEKDPHVATPRSQLRGHVPTRRPQTCVELKTRKWGATEPHVTVCTKTCHTGIRRRAHEWGKDQGPVPVLPTWGGTPAGGPGQRGQFRL